MLFRQGFRIAGRLSCSLLAILGLFLAGCESQSFSAKQTGDSPRGEEMPCPSAAGPITGPIIVGEDTTLLSMQENGENVQQLMQVPLDQWVRDPAWSPDGQTLAFSLSIPSSDPAMSGLPVGVICGIDRATGRGRLLARAPEERSSLREPSWTPDGQALLVAHYRPRFDEQQRFVGDDITLARYDLATHQLQPLIENAISPAPAPDGRRLAYVQLDPTTFAAHLMLADADGQNAQPLLAGKEGFAAVSVPRWSADGQRLVFVTRDSSTGSRDSAPRQRSLLERLFGVAVAEAHGAPADLWILHVERGQLEQIARRLDDPQAAWSPAGDQLAYTLGEGGVVLLDLARGQQRLLTERGNYGGIAWAPR